MDPLRQRPRFLVCGRFSYAMRCVEWGIRVLSFLPGGGRGGRWLGGRAKVCRHLRGSHEVVVAHFCGRPMPERRIA